MVYPHSGDFDVISKFRLTGAIVLLAATALALGGCGRKGGLDLPPTAASASTASVAAPTNAAAEAVHGPGVFTSAFSSTEAPPVAPKGKKKPFVLDPLLDN